MDDLKLISESKAIEEMINGKVISKIFRPRESEIVVEFADGARLIIDTSNKPKLEISITGGSSED